jgi:hypothetical protein
MAANPFDYLNAINGGKNIIAEADDPAQVEKDYPPFMVNRGLSYFPDTIMYANELNGLAHLDKLLQFDYLINSIRPRKRFSKWAKRREDSDLDVVVEYFGYGYKKAQQALSVLSTPQIEQIKQLLNKGGKP